MVGGLPEISLREKVLLWLSHAEAQGNGEPGIHATQAGIANATGMSRGHVSRTVAPLVASGLVKEIDERVPGFARVLKGYRLTGAGREEAEGLEGSLRAASVKVRRAGSEPVSMPLGQALASRRPPLSVWEAVAQVQDHDHLDLEGPPVSAPLKAQFLTEMSEAPTEAPFVGRERELDGFREWFASPARIYLLEAPGGLGKTTFLAHAVRAVRPRMHVHWVRVAGWTTGRALLERLDGLLRRLGRAGSPSESDGASALLEHLRPRLRGLPILLVLDDVQKGDELTLRVLTILATLAREGVGLRLVLVGRVVDLPGELFRDARTERLPPLSDQEARSLLETMGVAATQRPGLVVAARGNPLFLQLLARSPGPSPGGTDFGRYLARDLGANLPEPHRDVLRHLAALRAPVPMRVLERAGAGSRTALDELDQASLVVLRDGTVDMHDVVRDALYRQMEFREVRRVHSALAEAFRPRGDDWTGMTEFLHHLVKADRRDEAVRWVLRNQTRLMERAEDLFAPHG